MAAPNFDKCLALTLQFEGGYSNNPHDPGGATNMGITIGTLSQVRGHKVSVADVIALTREEAAGIYRRNYWNSIGGDHLAAGVDALAFDISVNSGPGKALLWLADTSGMVSPVARIRALDGKRRSFWQKLASWKFFGRGWTRREDAMLAGALKMAGG